MANHRKLRDVVNLVEMPRFDTNMSFSCHVSVKMNPEAPQEIMYIPKWMTYFILPTLASGRKLPGTKTGEGLRCSRLNSTDTSREKRRKLAFADERPPRTSVNRHLTDERRIKMK